jgi:hypothetical protein
MISPRKFRRLAAQTALEARRAQDSETREALLKKARLRLQAAKELERMGFREPIRRSPRPARTSKPIRQAAAR